MIVKLNEPETGATASVAPGQGFNCFQFATPINGRPQELLWAEADFSQGSCAADASGIPLLFPFVGRIPSGCFDYHEQKYTLTSRDRPPAIHGFVLDRPWRIVEQTDNQVTGQFRLSVDAPERLNEWPADVQLTVTYSIVAGELQGRAVAQNLGSTVAPIGFGWHPYLRCDNPARLFLDVTREWEMIDLQMTGRILSIDDAERFRFANGLELGTREFDNVYTGLPESSAPTHSQQGNSQQAATSQTRMTHSARLRSDQTEVRVAWSETLPHCVIYTPAHREAVCIEPWSTVPDCFRLEAEGIRTALEHLPAGKSVEYELRISASAAPA